MPRKPEGDRALTSAEKVRALHEHRALEGLTELRGAFRPPECHAEAKRILSEWLASLKPNGLR